MDIAGLVKGASQGEGLGNKFLTHIREVDAIVQVVRCFEDADVHHVSGTVDPVRDIEIINTELMLADLESVTKRRERVAQGRQARRQGRRSPRKPCSRSSNAALDAGKPALTVALTPEEQAIARQFFLLTDKPTIFACNVKDPTSPTADANPYVVEGPRLRGDAPGVRGGRRSARRSRASWSICRRKRPTAFLKELGVAESRASAR